ncbi:MAG TPA: DUF1841 family protein [Candidatus Competibacteraceae bacterium]|nr:DUF1841 family protein [Candidatus Competibacteraceae bacterium]MCP5133070.1 DUF1841 family protein [Gammaproteobacteria bacterium]HPF57376.1 DUF1841 family protein [Candidatus Competibacteraceae bacterium]
MFGNDRDNLRRYYCTVWEKARAGQSLEPLEQLIASVINEHPEYQAVLTDTETALSREYTPEGGQTNPFLHMGMHIAIQEQLGGNRPAGILAVYQQLCQRIGDTHAAEHAMMECLGEALWEAQRSGHEPDEQVYLERLRRLV